MALTPPPSGPPAAPTEPGDAPSRANPSTFRELADAFVVWQVGFRDWLAGMVAWLAGYISWASTNVTEMDALQTDVTTKSSAATTAASSAAVNAAAVQANRTALDNRLYPGTYAADPATRPDGSAVQAGDRYFNTSIARQKTFSGSVWATDNLDSAALAGSGGASLVGIQQAGAGSVPRNVQDELRERLHVQQFMTAAQIADANNPAGPTNDMHSAGFAACFAFAKLAGIRRVWVPPVAGAYSVRGVEVPVGLALVGESTKPFDPADVTGVYGAGSVIVRASGGTSMFLWNAGCKAEGLLLHGVDKAVDCFQSATGARLTSLRIMECGLHGWHYAIGNPGYLQTLRAFYCNISDNMTGVYGLVDSMVAMCYISYNDARGVDQQGGANDTCFFCNRVEWNGTENFAFQLSVRNSIEGGNIDRSGLAGIEVVNAQVRINPAYIWRSGKNILGANNCAHIHLNGAACDVSIGPIITTSGINDDSTGDLTPNYGISLGGAEAPARVVMAGGNLTGCVTSAVNLGIDPLEFKMLGVAGAEDRVNSGLARAQGGRRYFQRSTLMTVAPGVVSAATTVGFPALSTFAATSAKVRVEARNTANGSAIVGEAIAAIQREGAGATVTFAQAPFQSSVASGVSTPATNLVGGSSAETLQLQFANVAADASTFDVTVKNNHATATYQVRLTAVQ